MCGIFGILARQGARLGHSQAQELLEKLYTLSESRGKESAGLHVYLPRSGQAWTLKGAQRATELLRSKEYGQITTGPMRKAFGDKEVAGFEAPLVLLAHSRLVTNGSAALPMNNQPVRSGRVTMIHNGICVNVEALWQQHAHLQRHAEVDTEVMAALVDDGLRQGQSTAGATQRMFAQLQGAASIAWTDDAGAEVTLATNTGDLYYTETLDKGFIVFASERYILQSAVADSLSAPAIHWLEPGQGISIDLDSQAVMSRFDLAHADDSKRPAAQNRPAAQHIDQVTGRVGAAAVTRRPADESLLRYGEARVRALLRCSRCVLPHTFPFIEFDAGGVCNYCNNYRPRYATMATADAKRDFIQSLERYRRNDGQPDVIVAFSGGRDSSYGLHLIKKEFGLNPITFTYDWGMVTDLARRNIARVCGKLGVQNILVSADIAKKRDNIRLNVSAWLKKPDLGLIPLFMAGDKHFFRVVNELKRQTGIKLDLWCANPLENTDFKTGFCGVSPEFNKSRVDYLSLGRKAKLAAYYGLRFAQNPSYLNSSLVDTAGAFMSYYFEPRTDFYSIFNHFIWNEDEVNQLLIPEYDWELAPDSTSSWRIGDGTAPFYNYVYMTARGFSEFDTFRSNQIREGMISREEALEKILVENRPRTQTMRWYLETIGLEFDDVIKVVNRLDTMGLHQ